MKLPVTSRVCLQLLLPFDGAILTEDQWQTFIYSPMDYDSLNRLFRLESLLNPITDNLRRFETWDDSGSDDSEGVMADVLLTPAQFYNFWGLGDIPSIKKIIDDEAQQIKTANKTKISKWMEVGVAGSIEDQSVRDQSS